MPVPSPRKEEEQQEFISRCIRFLVEEGREQEQAQAICYDQWRNRNKSIKQYLCNGLPKVINKDDRIVEFMINTANTDREGEIMLPLGAQLDNYKKNPVVLWDHNPAIPPIGRTVKISRSKHGLKAKVQFAETWRADEIYNLIKNGFLNTASVGYLTQKSIKRNEAGWKDIAIKLAQDGYPITKQTKRILTKWELLEWSVVPVPSNPNALRRAFETKSIKLSDEMQKAFGLIEEQEEPTEEKEPKPAKVEVISTPGPKQKSKPIIISQPKEKYDVIVIEEIPKQKSLEIQIIEEIERKRGRV